MGEQQGEGVPVPGRLKPTTQIFTSNSKTTTKTTQNAKPREAFWVKKKKNLKQDTVSNKKIQLQKCMYIKIFTEATLLNIHTVYDSTPAFKDT